MTYLKPIEDVSDEDFAMAKRLTQRMSKIISGERTDIALNTLVCLLAFVVVNMPIEVRPEALAHITKLLVETVKQDTPEGMVQ